MDVAIEYAPDIPAYDGTGKESKHILIVWAVNVVPVAVHLTFNVMRSYFQAWNTRVTRILMNIAKDLSVVCRPVYFEQYRAYIMYA